MMKLIFEQFYYINDRFSKKTRPSYNAISWQKIINHLIELNSQLKFDALLTIFTIFFIFTANYVYDY